VAEYNQSKQTIACTYIVAGSDPSEAPLLAQSLSSINGYVDAIYIQLNAPKGQKIDPKVRQVAEQYTDNISVFEWTGNFVKARKAIFDKVPKKYDWIMFLDSDDVVDVPEQIQPNLAIVPKSVNAIRILYNYDHDDHGNVVVHHWVTRVVRNNGSFEWKSSIDDDEVSVHETLIAVRPTQSVGTEDWAVNHNSKRERREASLLRNIELLQGMYERQSKKGGADPRILFYLATHYYDAYDFDHTMSLLAEYLKQSGWAEERSEAHYYMGKILAMRGNSNAKTAFLMAIGEFPDNVSAHVELAKLEIKSERYERAAEWLVRANRIERELTPMVRKDNKYELYTLLSQCYCNIGGKRLEDAYTYAKKALKLRPFDPNAQANRDTVKKLIDYRDNMKAVTRLVRELEKNHETKKIMPLIRALPADLADSIPVIDAYQRYTAPKKWPKRSIAIYVGQSPLGIWGPWSLNEGGVGGSEEAVVRLTRLLAKLEWKVTVYGCPGERAKTYEGVEWKQYWEMNAKDTFDIFVSWRQPHVFDYKLKARKRYLWLHDIVPETEFTKERIKNFDRAIFVSQYHADRPEFKSIPKAKKFVSANGIDSALFSKMPKVTRDPYRCIYMSANERGLRVLLEIWPDVKKAVPKATLDAYYGWQSFDAIQRDNPERMMWKATMIQKMKELKGVTERGRIGQDDLHKEIFKSGIFAYPCTFPEVSCITAMKAQAGGAIPVTSDFANLKDVIHFGEKVPMGEFDEEGIEHYKKRLIYWLQHPEKQEAIRVKMMLATQREFSWTHVAQQWNGEME
jgi:glycosyltransferase involved in cell wall biosynthesis